MREKTLDRALWASQLGLAAAFSAAGGMKVFMPICDLHEKLDWTQDQPDALVRFIGASELAGAIGSVLPAATPRAHCTSSVENPRHYRSHWGSVCSPGSWPGDACDVVPSNLGGLHATNES